MHYKTYKNILSANNGMNIYRGCSHNCIYCDSRSICYNMQHDFEDIEVKDNAPLILEKELKSRRKKCMIGTGSMTDSYIPLEETLEYTKKCLEVIRKYGFGAVIQTKSSRILRDLDILKKINENAKCVVAITLTTYNEDLCKIIEPNVSSTKERFETLKTLHDNGIPTVVWLCPILPFINDDVQNLRGILNYCIEAKASSFINTKLIKTQAINPSFTSEEDSSEIVISLLGDCTIGMDEDSTYNNNFNSVLEKNGVDYFITGEVREILTSDDLTLANLETPLTDSTDIQQKQFNFKGAPENIEILINGGIDIVNISNNHTNDYGLEGYTDTIETLDDYEVPFSGDEYVTVKEVKGKTIGFFGLKKANLTKENIDARIETLNSLGADIIIASVHWGEEGKYDFNDEQEDLGHYMIDQGVDIVSGNHPHCLQGIEEYNGGIIAYSSGNFCFGGNKNPKDKDTMILQIKIDVSKENQNFTLNIIPCKISSTDKYNDFRPTPATGDEEKRIKDKILKLSPTIKNIVE